MKSPSVLPCLLLLAAAPFALSSASAALLTEDFDSNDGGFVMTSTGAPSGPWTYSGGGGTWFANGEGNLGASTSSELTSPAFLVPSGGPVSLAISHRYSFELDTVRWDGGQIQYSVNNGAWAPVSAANFTSGGYDGVIAGNNVLTGLEGFNGNSPDYLSGGFITSSALVGSFAAGDSLQIRFQAGWDEFATGTAPNWEITSVSVVPEPASAAVLAAAAGLLALRRRRA